MVNHALETSRPTSSHALCLRASVVSAAFRLPYTLPSSVSRNPFCLPLLRKLPGCVPTIPILERAIRLASLPRCLLTFLLPCLITPLLSYFTTVAVPPDHCSTVPGALASFRT
jgi:hypothetical protein